MPPAVVKKPRKSATGELKKRKQGRPNRGAGGVGRETLIAAARAVLGRKRPEQITRLDIAQEAGVDPGLVRYYFGDTSELLLAAALEAANDLRLEQMRLAEVEGSPREKLAARIRGLVRTTSREPYMHHLFVDKIVSGDSPQVKEARAGMVTRGREELARIIGEGVRTGEMRPMDAGILYLAIVGATTFPVSERKLFAALLGRKEFRESDLELYVEGLIDLFMRGLAAD